MELIQIHISDPIRTKLCTRLSLGLEETVGYLWTRNSWPLRPYGPFFFPLTSRKWHRSRRHIHPPQHRIPYSGGCLRHVTDITFNWATGPSATALYPSF